jgi:hypothetical protein
MFCNRRHLDSPDYVFARLILNGRFERENKENFFTPSPGAGSEVKPQLRTEAVITCRLVGPIAHYAWTLMDWWLLHDPYYSASYSPIGHINSLWCGRLKIATTRLHITIISTNIRYKLTFNSKIRIWRETVQSRKEKSALGEFPSNNINDNIY